MAAPRTTAAHISSAVGQLAPYLGAFASSWCRRVLFSMLHHTSKAAERDIFYRDEAELRTLWANPWPGSSYDPYFEYELRWCPRCLALGYHSTVQQLVELVRCPMHNVPIERGCPHCRFALPCELPAYPADFFRPARSCPHCGRDLLNLEQCGSWIKSKSFQRLEQHRLQPLLHWTRRITSGHLHIIPHEPAGTGVLSSYPTAPMLRAAIEYVFPLPTPRLFAPRPPNLRVVAVWLDRQAIRAPEVSESVKLEVFRALTDHFGAQPVPEGWLSRTSVDEIDQTVADLTEFAYFCDQYEFGRERVLVSHPEGEVLRPAMFTLWAHRFLRDYDAWRRHADVFNACTICWTRQGDAYDKPAPGTVEGCLVEAYWVGRRTGSP